MAFSKQAAVERIAGTSPGNELVKGEDQQVPFVTLIQAMSPELHPGQPKYCAEARVGEFFDRGSRASLGGTAHCLNVFFRTRYAVWRPRAQGGGMVQQFSTDPEARAFAARKPQELEYTGPAHDHVIMLYDREGALDPMPRMFTMDRSKLGPSRTWNSALQRAHSHRFAAVWRLDAVTQSRNNEVFYNLTVNQETDAWATPEDFALAKVVYESMRDGLREEHQLIEKDAAATAPTEALRPPLREERWDDMFPEVEEDDLPY